MGDLIASRPPVTDVLAKKDPTRVARARALVEDANRKGAELDAARALLPEAVCQNCQAVLYQYRPPITYVLVRCRRCASWQEFTAT